MHLISSFWIFFGSLVAVGSLLEDFLEPFGNLGGDFEKTFRKVTKKDLKNGVPHRPIYAFSGNLFFYKQD